VRSGFWGLFPFKGPNFCYAKRPNRSGAHPAFFLVCFGIPVPELKNGWSMNLATEGEMMLMLRMHGTSGVRKVSGSSPLAKASYTPPPPPPTEKYGTKMCCWFFRSGFLCSDRREYFGFVL
jgi:hypothetical protein